MISHLLDGSFQHSINQDREDREGESPYSTYPDRDVISHIPDGSFQYSVDQDRENREGEPLYSIVKIAM